jgi:hypothetical protein
MGLRSCLTRLRRWFRSARPAAAPRRLLLLEQLEVRDVPAVGLSQAYLAVLYQGFLARPIDPVGLTFWGGVLNNTGGDRTAVAADILQSQEFRGRELQLVYPALLGRPLDTPGLQFWGKVLETGGTYEQVKAGIFGSQEYFNRVGDTFPNFLNGVFQSQLGRAPTVAEVATYTTLFGQTGGDRTAVAQQILNSDAAHQVALNGVYQEILTRPLDPTGSTFWVNAIRGGTIDTALAGVVGSDEFFREMTNFVNTGTEANVTDVNQAVNDFLNAGAKFEGQPPGVEQLDRLSASNSAIRTSPVASVALATAISAAASTITPTVGTTAAPASTLMPINTTVPLLTGTGASLSEGGIGSVTGTATNISTVAGAGAVTGTTAPVATSAGAGALTGASVSLSEGGIGSVTGTSTNFSTGAGAGTVTGTGMTFNSGFSTFF